MGRTYRLAATAVALLVAVVGVRGFVAEPRTVTSESMSPAFRQGDVVLVDKLSPRVRSPQLGDVVAFADPQDGDTAMKRVVALGGQEVAIRDAVLHVDGVPVDEPGIDVSRIDGTWFGPVHVPEDAVFVLGDSRAGSIDSRIYGAVPLTALDGRVVGRVWPPG